MTVSTPFDKGFEWRISAFKPFVLLICTLHFSCDPGRESLTTYHPKVVHNGFSVDEFVSEIEYIPLKEHSRAFLNYIKEVTIFDNWLLILCTNRKALFIFDNQGHFVKTIQYQGQGPLELGGFDGIEYVPNSDNILILDADNKRISIYNIRTDIVEDELRFPDFVPKAIFLQDRFLFIMTSDYANGCIKVYDLSTRQQISSYLYSPSFIGLIPTQLSFDTDNGNLYFGGGFTDTIYRLSSTAATPYFAINNGETSMSQLDESFIGFLLGRRLKDNIPEMIIPQGVYFTEKKLHFIADFYSKKMVVVDAEKQASYSLEESVIKNYHAIDRAYFANIGVMDKEGYSYSDIYLSDKLYDLVQQYEVSNSQASEVMNALTGLVTNIAKEQNFENPIIVKYKVDFDKLRNLLIESVN